jgi:peptidoglycan hydrolase CwlO-like protein|tara:strand:- start:43 stop:336 length:294 start_codon:yes stop_codon:yes gene_type:complete
MEIKATSLLGLLPVVMVASGALFSYASLEAAASANSEDIEDVIEQVEEVEDDISELQQKMTKTEIQLSNVAEDIGDVRADTKTILTILSNQRVPTEK